MSGVIIHGMGRIHGMLMHHCSSEILSDLETKCKHSCVAGL